MKKQSNILFTKFSGGTLADLTREIKETLATGFDLPRQQTFTAADLWNIQRRKRSVSVRNFSF